MPSLGDLILRIGADATGFDAVLGSVSSNLAHTGLEMTALAVPIAALGGAALSAAIAFDDASDKIRLGTGATGAALAGLEDSFKRVFTTLPVSAEQASTAITMIHQRTGETGPALEELASQVLRLAKFTGTDLTAAIPALTRVFGDWGIATDKQGSSLDFLFRLTQQTGVGLQSLTEKVVQFGSPMRALGFSFDEAAVLLAKFEKEGVALETAMPGLRIGLQNLAKQGVDNAAEALKILIERIKEAPNPMAAAALAAETFGKRAGTDLSQAIREGRFDIDKLLASVRDGKDTLSSAEKDVADFAEAFQLLKNRVTAALQPLGKVLFDALGDLADRLKPVADMVGSLSEKFKTLDPDARMAVAAFGALVVAIGPVSLAVSGVVKGIGSMTAGLPVLSSALGLSTGAFFAWLVPIGLALGAITAIALKSMELSTAQDELARAQEGHSAAIAKMEIMLRQQGIDISALSQEYKNGVISQDQYQKSLADLLVQAGKSGAALAAVGTSAKFTASAASQASAALKDAFASLKITPAAEARAELAKLKTAYETIAKAVKDGRADVKDQEAAWKAYAQAAGIATGETDKLGKSYLHFNTALLDQVVAHNKLRMELVLAKGAYVWWLMDFPKFVEETLAFTESLNKMGAAIFDVSTVKLPKFVTSTLTGVETIRKLTEALNSTGVNQTVLDENEAKYTAFYDAISESGIATSTEITQAWLNMEYARIAADAAANGQIDQAWKDSVDKVQGTLNESLGKTNEHAEKQKSVWSAMGTQVSTVFTDLSKSLTDLMFEGGKFGDIMVKAAEDIGKAIVRTLVEGAFKQLMGSIASALAGMDGLLGKVGEWLGGGASAAGSAGNAAGSAGGAAGAAGGAAAGGAASIVTAIASVGSLVTGIIGIFQSSKQETTLNAIEESTRRVSIAVTEGPNPMAAELTHVREKLFDIWVELTQRTGARLDAIKDYVRFLQYDRPGKNDSAIEGLLREIANNVRTPPIVNVTVNIPPSSETSSSGESIVRSIRGQGGFAFA